MPEGDPSLPAFSKNSPVDESLLVVSEEGEDLEDTALDSEALLSIDETLNPFEQLLDNTGISREELTSVEGGDRPSSAISECDTSTENTPSPDIPPSIRSQGQTISDGLLKFPGRAISCK